MGKSILLWFNMGKSNNPIWIYPWLMITVLAFQWVFDTHMSEETPEVFL